MHIDRAMANFYHAEHDPQTNEVLTAEGYEIKDAAATVPNAPGFGLGIVDKGFASAAKIVFGLRG